MANQLLAAAGLVLLLGGCASTQPGHLYNMKTGQNTTFQVSNGELNGTLPDGARCEGQFDRVSNENAKRNSTVAPTHTDNSSTSTATVNCGPSRTLRCTLAGRRASEFSFGECSDQQGTPYSVVF